MCVMEGNFDLWETLTKPLQYIRLYTGDLATSNLGDLICSSCNLMPDYVTVNVYCPVFYTSDAMSRYTCKDSKERWSEQSLMV